MAKDHNHDIALAAKAVLGPNGFVRKGKSRTWLNDQGWWAGVVEFQPSGFSKGSYLNVGACFLWVEKEYMSFDDMAGDRPWRGVTNGGSFADEATELANEALSTSLELGARHANIANTADWLSRKSRLSCNWGHFHAAVAHGLSGDAGIARNHFNAAVDPSTDIAWAIELNRACALLVDELRNHSYFVETVQETIRRARKAMRLPDVQNPLRLA